MSDWFLKKIWGDIKDPSWPEIEYWDDFLKLDKDIQKESLQRHNIHHELSRKFHNQNFWKNYVHADFYQNGRFVFVNLPKCGLKHHKDFFVNRLGWKEKNYSELIDQKNLVYFGLMMDPLKRYLKGITEFIWKHKLQNVLDLETFMSEAALPDAHSIPYSILVPMELEKVHWIPFSNMTTCQVKESMNQLFKIYHSDLIIPTDHPPIHQSSDEKLKIFEDVKNAWENQYNSMYMIYYFHGHDIQFYKKLIEEFKPDWSHIDKIQVDRE